MHVRIVVKLQRLLISTLNFLAKWIHLKEDTYQPETGLGLQLAFCSSYYESTLIMSRSKSPLIRTVGEEGGEKPTKKGGLGWDPLSS